MSSCQDKNFNKELIKIENTKFKTIDNLVNSKEMNFDKLYWDSFLELPKEYAYETWYLKDKNNINQFKIEEDIIKHWSIEQQLLLIKTRPYWYIKETIRDFNLLNWRWYWNYHFIDFYWKKMKDFEKLLWKKLLSLPFKEMIKTIFYFWFPWEWSSQIINNDWTKYIK